MDDTCERRIDERKNILERRMKERRMERRIEEKRMSLGRGGWRRGENK